MILVYILLNKFEVNGLNYSRSLDDGLTFAVKSYTIY